MQTPTPIRIAHLCRSRICRDALILRCKERTEFQVVASLQRLEDTVDEIVSVQPHVVLVDVDLPGGAFESAERLRSRLSRAKLMFVAPRISDLCIKQALALGAAGMALSSETIDQLLDHLWKISEGQASFSPEIRERLWWDAQRQSFCLPHNAAIDSITDKQLQVLRHVARGDSLKMIASKMKLTRKAVDGHKYRLMKKIGLQDRVLLSRFAIREGLIDP